MRFEMKSILSIVVVLFACSNLYSQSERLDELLKHKNSDQYLSYEEGVDKSVFENRSNQILKVRTFDSTSVVDSVIVTRENGDKGKYTYTYDSNGNTISELHESWEGSQWVNGARYTYVLDPNGNTTSLLYEQWDGNQWLNCLGSARIGLFLKLKQYYYPPYSA